MSLSKKRISLLPLSSSCQSTFSVPALVFALSLILACSLVFPFSALATASPSEVNPDTQTVPPLDPKKRGLISLSCPSIKLQLQKIQKNDARARVYLGAEYETINSNLMVNFNLRLTKNHYVLPEFVNSHAEFKKLHENFKTNYIHYAESLNKLTELDCKDSPDDFYQQLQVVRGARAGVDSDTAALNGKLEQYRALVLNFKSGLQKNE